MVTARQLWITGPRPSGWLPLLGMIAACTQAPRDDFALSGGTGGDDTDGETTAISASSADGSTGGPACAADDDCVDDPAGPVCDLQAGNCTKACEVGETRPCYSGPPGTQDIGACVAGVNLCTTQGTWDGWCEGEIVPTAENCNGGVDDDCDGLVDDTDQDGDGYGACSGDCCDVEGANCTGAELVNAGAFEVSDNRVDDDCDGELDEPTPPCDEGLASSSSDAMDYARAMELCATTAEEPASSEERTWGVISAKLSRANGQGSPSSVQRSIRGAFGDIIDPEANASMTVLSTGHAAGQDDTNPAFAPFQAGVDLGSSVAAPADWVAANGGSFPNPAGCTQPWSTEANDSAMLTLRVRVPTNARSFSVRMQFFSAEYPEWVCSAFNDFFVALVDSTGDNPQDGNIAVFDDGATLWPVGVNLVMIAEGLFTQCQNGQVGCAEAPASTYEGCLGTALLPGTGFDLFDDGCDAGQDQVGGGTGWLTMSGNVMPGEIVEIRLAIWDTSGHIFDSLVLLDAWEWSLEGAMPGIAPG